MLNALELSKEHFLRMEFILKSTLQKITGWYFVPNSKLYGDIGQRKSIPQSPAESFL